MPKTQSRVQKAAAPEFRIPLLGNGKYTIDVKIYITGPSGEYIPSKPIKKTIPPKCPTCPKMIGDLVATALTEALGLLHLPVEPDPERYEREALPHCKE